MSEEEPKTMEDKLRVLEQEIRLIHEFCVNKGYNPWQVEKSAQPLLDSIKQARRKRLVAILFKVAIFIGVVAALLKWNPAYKLVLAHGRLASIKILPYWDWTQYYHTDCLIENPLFTGNPLMEEDCELCENLEGIERISNVSHNVMAEDYLKRDIPVVITDGMDQWEAQKRFNIQFIHELYTTEDSLKEYVPCMFQSNVRVNKYGNVRTLLSKAVQGSISNWYAHWENCDKEQAKVIRQYFKRPYFLPPMVEGAESNWIFVSQGYKGKKNKAADIALPMMWFAQLKGRTKITLTPKSPCNATCVSLFQTVHEGEILVTTDMMWMLDYMPDGSPENIAIGGGGYFD